MTTEKAVRTNDDTELTQAVRAAQAGDRQALGTLIERYQRAVYAIVYRRPVSYTHLTLPTN